jgi:hypothetical protein
LKQGQRARFNCNRKEATKSFNIWQENSQVYSNEQLTLLSCFKTSRDCNIFRSKENDKTLKHRGGGKRKTRGEILQWV